MTAAIHEPNPGQNRHYPSLNVPTFLGELMVVCGVVAVTICSVLSVLNASTHFGLPNLDSHTIPLLLLIVALLVVLDRVYAHFQAGHAVVVLRATLVICLLFFLVIVPREAGTFQDYCIYVPTLTGILGAPASGLIAIAELLQFLIRGLTHRAESVGFAERSET